MAPSPPVRNTVTDRGMAATSVARGGGREMKIIQVVAFGPEDLPYAIPKQSYLHRSEISQHGS